MKALLTTGEGPFGLRHEEVPEPVPAPGEALVRVRAVSVNRGELALAAVSPPGTRLGWDVAGTVVEAAADGSGPAPGTRVVGLADGGGWAERVALPVSRLAPVPDAVTDERAAALPVAALTAWYGLRKAGPLLGRTVLVTGAGGGVARIAVQLAAAAGARVVAWTGSPERGHGLAELGAEVVSTYEEAAGGGSDVLFDSVGGEVLTRAFVTLRRGGTAVVYGNTTRSELVLPPDWGRARPGVSLHNVFLFDEIERHDPAADLGTLLGLCAAGRLDPQVAATASWDDPAEVLKRLEGRSVNGKVVLRLG
ncbi:MULTISPECIES: zinc-binding dehydrogenase [unclassified Streptomyces]|uniref:zinc-binding dehydrogenase n=1 Tax=unclassified Streptomyces TaxID=2593676 RepID=UPI0006AEE1E9|nr:MULTISPECIES: zinc-binding dehydrogenase [unclassified Streptomyces]KOX18747.1 alcohol dehydrogenase [Streptomyces sp. NRRL F-6491]KOX37459.1 alcohol dehydrogenase [Streptomyces sp. NRRL F-6492]